MDIFLNRELIAVNQDTLGSRAWKVRDDGQKEVWARRLGDSSYAVVFFNMDLTAAPIQVTWSELKSAGSKALVRDLWIKKDAGVFTDSYSVSVPAHGAAFLKVTPEKFITKISADRPEAPLHRMSSGITARFENGVIRVALRESPGAPLRMRCVLSTISGKKVAGALWSIIPGSSGANLLRVPTGCRTGMYILSLKNEGTDQDWMQTSVMVYE